MVKRLSAMHTYMVEQEEGKYVDFEDYQFLQAALREALDGWETWSGGDLGLLDADKERIAELRKQFLDI